jgi:hypothetical protein
MFTERSTSVPELTKACGTFAGATTMSPACASIVSLPTVNVAFPAWTMNVSAYGW